MTLDVSLLFVTRAKRSELGRADRISAHVIVQKKFVLYLTRVKYPTGLSQKIASISQWYNS